MAVEMHKLICTQRHFPNQPSPEAERWVPHSTFLPAICRLTFLLLVERRDGDSCIAERR
jgi:hypothetical protein